MTLTFGTQSFIYSSGSDSSVGRVSAPGNGRSWVRSRAAKYQSRSNGTSYSSLGTQVIGVELLLVDPVSGQCDWVWYHVKCLGHETSVKQHYKSEHLVPCRNQTSS